MKSNDSAKKSLSLGRKSLKAVVVIWGLFSIYATVASAIDSYNTGGFVWTTIHTGSPLLIGWVLIQTTWFLFAVLLAAGLVICFHEGRLTRDRLVFPAVFALISSFLLTWGIRASYFGVTGQYYPGQDILEFRIETGVAGFMFIVTGIIVAIFTLISASESETDTDSYLMDYSVPISDPTQIAQLQKQLQESLDSMRQKRETKHSKLCKSYEKQCQDQGMVHFGIAEQQAKPCTCSCHKNLKTTLVK